MFTEDLKGHFRKLSVSVRDVFSLQLSAHMPQNVRAKFRVADSVFAPCAQWMWRKQQLKGGENEIELPLCCDLGIHS